MGREEVVGGYQKAQGMKYVAQQRQGEGVVVGGKETVEGEEQQGNSKGGKGGVGRGLGGGGGRVEGGEARMATGRRVSERGILGFAADAERLAVQAVGAVRRLGR